MNAGVHRLTRLLLGSIDIFPLRHHWSNLFVSWQSLAKFLARSETWDCFTGRHTPSSHDNKSPRGPCLWPSGAIPESQSQRWRDLHRYLRCRKDDFHFEFSLAFPCSQYQQADMFIEFLQFVPNGQKRHHRNTIDHLSSNRIGGRPKICHHRDQIVLERREQCLPKYRFRGGRALEPIHRISLRPGASSHRSS